MTIAPANALSGEGQYTPTWKRFLTTPAPTRFIATVNAYLDTLRSRGITLSQRQLSIDAMGPGSHGVLNGLERHPDRKPSITTVARIVNELNDRYLPSADRWPVTEAMVAAGQRSQAVTETVIRDVTRDTGLDFMPGAYGVFSLPVIDIARVADDGLRRAIDRNHALNISSDMLVLAGMVPGYPFQRAGEFVLAQNPANTQGIESAWALVRQGGAVYAKSRADLTKGDQRLVIGWLVGVIRFPSDDDRELPPAHGEG